ncbi:MAG: protein kinase, partial [Chlamydiia bacterium]|nr:protein kinase [Chlamydiia bacterium]
RVVCKDVSGDLKQSKRIYVNYGFDELNFTSHPSAVNFLKVQTLHRAAIEDISSYLKHNKISTAEKLSLMRDMALGVQILHKKFRMIHRDLKIQNILVYRDRGGYLRAKITDFGFLKSTDGVLDNHAGTPAYSPRESLLLKKKYSGVIPLEMKSRIKNPPSPRPTDMYSLGMTFFSLLAEMEPTLVKQFWLNPDTLPQMVANEKTRLDSFEFVNKKISDLSIQKMGMLQALIGSLISADADRRPNIDQVIEVLNHLISLPTELQG